MASCTASSAEEKSRKRRATEPSTCGASSRNRCSEVVVPWLCHRSSRYSISGGGPLIIGRTSIGMFNGVPPGPGAADAFAAMA